MSYKKAILFLFAALMLIFTPLWCCCVRAQDAQPNIYLEGATDAASGIFILKIMLSPQDISLCGLELDITYDSTKVTLCSCERGGALKPLEFDCSLGEGRIRLLLWGEENSNVGGRIATLCFLPTDSCDGEIEFILSLPTKNSAIYFEDNKILSQDLLLKGLRVDLGAPEISTDRFTEKPTELPSASEQENPSAETPTEEFTDKYVSEDPPNVSQHKSKNNGSFQKILGALLAVSTAASSICVVPLLFPRVFWKGYF